MVSRIAIVLVLEYLFEEEEEETSLFLLLLLDAKRSGGGARVWRGGNLGRFGRRTDPWEDHRHV